MSENYQDISIEIFQELVSSSANPTLLCGNGLSINFEPNLTLSGLGEKMYMTHLHILNFSNYRALTPKMKQAFLPNYKATIKYLKRIIQNKDDFSNFFSDAVNFAKKHN